MLSFTGSLRVFVALEPCDMRKGFDGLSGMVASKLNEDLQSGALFVFSNRSHTRLKIIYWDGSGVWLMAKRLEKGTFSWPKDTDGKNQTLTATRGVGDAHRRGGFAGWKNEGVVSARGLM
jgi:transposase